MFRLKTTQPLLTAALLGALGLFAALPAHAQSVDGEVMKIDKPQQKITLKHGEIPNLEMPPMTMSFKVPQAVVLDSLKVGDRVKFDADKVGGQYTVVKLVPVK